MFSYKRERRRMVKSHQDCLKLNGVRNPGEKRREGVDKEPSPLFGNINFGVRESSNSDNILDILSFFSIFIEVIFSIFTAFSENYFHFTPPDDQGIQTISTYYRSPS